MDAIIALATPPGLSALAVLRISGPDALSLLRRLTPSVQEWKPQRAVHVLLRNDGLPLDDVVATYWARPHSYTGEDVVEISSHGNPLLVQKVLSAFLQEGARLARPGEFTQRAFLNGKLDLTQAEAVMDVLSAATEEALQGAQAMQRGKLGHAMQQLRQDLIDLLAHLEAYIDFPEEDINPETGSIFFQRVESLQQRIVSLRQTAPLGKILREGVRTVIVGEPNVGKSSLLNALLRENRAIVSAHPGTTRDTIEAECNVGGFRLRLLDTAGRRETTDEVESEGVRRAQQALEEADLILHVVEAHQPLAASFRLTPQAHQRYLPVANKADLGVDSSHAGSVVISTLRPEGIAPLEKAIIHCLQMGAPVLTDGWLTVNARQETALGIADQALRQAQAAMQDKAPPELVYIDLRAALQAVGEVVGLATEEDILDQIFKNFCIGK